MFKMKQHARSPYRQNEQRQIKEWIQQHGCFSEEINLKIFEKWFQKPRRSFWAVFRHLHLVDKQVCDVGCGYGNNLIYCHPNSYGLEIKQSAVDFAQSIGLTVYQRDVFDDLSDLPQADVVWCADVLEHVESPHIFLRKLTHLLRPDGLVILKIPTIPRRRIPFPYLTQYQTGYLADDHINGFTGETLRFMCERSGFHTRLVGVFLHPALRWLNSVAWLRENIGQTLYIGHKIAQWQYPKRAMRIATVSGNGFLYEQKHHEGKYTSFQKPSLQKTNVS